MTADNGMDFLAIPPVYPGTPLKKGSTGNNVKTMQYYLDAIGTYIYPSLSFLTVDGIFGSKTETTVKKYQTTVGLVSDGVIGQNTWSSIVADYGTIPDSATEIYPGMPLSYGSTGIGVVTMQTKLNEINPTYTAIPTQTVDGNFGTNATNAARLFQRQFGLKADGIIGEQTWYAIIGVHQRDQAGNPDGVMTAYPGYVLSTGSSGDYVRYVQSYMNRIGAYTGAGFPAVTVDGSFGSRTKALVTAFQTRYGLAADGKVGSATWSVMIPEFNATLNSAP